jgi:hypothetical protein
MRQLEDSRQARGDKNMETGVMSAGLGCGRIIHIINEAHPVFHLSKFSMKMAASSRKKKS